MKKRLVLIVGLAVLLPVAGRAQVSVGARTGYSIPLGDADGSAAMSDVTSGQVPLHLDLGYRLSGTSVTVGGYFAYAFGSPAGLTKDTCTSAGVSCSTTTLHAGAQVLWEFGRPEDSNVPWLGLGLGYDGLSLKAANGGASSKLTMDGVEFILQGGYDRRFGSGTIGGFASFSMSRYTDISSGGQSGSIQDTQVHQWLTLGIRGSFSLGN